MRTSAALPKGLTVAASEIVAAVEHICFDYGTDRVLDQVTLAVRRGDFLGIIGPNGSGKTTLLRILLGLLRPSCGHVSLFGTDVRHFRDWHRIGYVPQKAAVEARFPASVFEVVISGRAARVGPARRFGRADREATERALGTVGMTPFRDRLIGRLSPGQQQRVFIARALVHEPELLLLDEPFGALDAFTREELWQVLQDLWLRRRFTGVLVTHDLREAVFLADRVYIMSPRPGRITASAPIDLPRPRTLEDTFSPRFTELYHEIRRGIGEGRR